MGKHAAAMALGWAALCASPAAAADLSVAQHITPPAYAGVNVGPTLLGTMPVPIHAARFAESWARAQQDATTSPRLQQLIAPLRSYGKLQQANLLQRIVHDRVRWMSDATLWGQHDYWASAAETLARGAGDMEDRAIVKMQALRALGFNPGDLYLTLGRDRVAGPITVLMVRIGGRFFMLDDTDGPAVLLDRRGFEFQPAISFGYGGTWVHAQRASTIAMRPTASPYASK